MESFMMAARVVVPGTYDVHRYPSADHKNC